MVTKVDEIEKVLATQHKGKIAVSGELSQNFTESVMEAVKVVAERKRQRQVNTAWRVGWITFAAAALVMVYFGISYDQISLTDELMSAVYTDDSTVFTTGISELDTF